MMAEKIRTLVRVKIVAPVSILYRFACCPKSMSQRRRKGTAISAGKSLRAIILPVPESVIIFIIPVLVFKKRILKPSKRKIVTDRVSVDGNGLATPLRTEDDI